MPGLHMCASYSATCEQTPVPEHSLGVGKRLSRTVGAPWGISSERESN